MRNWISLTESILKEAKRTTAADFVKMVQTKYGAKSNKLSWKEIMDAAADNDVQIPSEIRHNYKLDAHTWNLSGGDSEDVDSSVAKDLGVDVGKTDSEVPTDYNDILSLAKIKHVSRLASSGKLYLFGRKPKGAFFRVPGLEELTAQLERMLARELESQGDATMEQQYKQLTDKVGLIAGGQSHYIKSLLITGAPSSGKTYNVMQKIKELGLIEGKDYIIKKGRITVLSMYRTLIEQINGLTVFDDCDSVVEDKNGINMLKGALDTDPVREISYDVRGTVNIASLPESERTEYAERVSRALRFVETAEDISYFRNFLERTRMLSKVLKGLKKKSTEDEFEDDDEFEEDADENDRIVQYVRTHLPNKIDFKGRIIFISNMDESEWDGAILSRAIFQNMSFRSDEMLSFIDKIKGSFKTPGLTEEEKEEVINYIRELYHTGKLKKPINFRLIQQAFDIRLTSTWKEFLSSM